MFSTYGPLFPKSLGMFPFNKNVLQLDIPIFRVETNMAGIFQFSIFRFGKSESSNLSEPSRWFPLCSSQEGDWFFLILELVRGGGGLRVMVRVKREERGSFFLGGEWE